MKNVRVFVIEGSSGSSLPEGQRLDDMVRGVIGDIDIMDIEPEGLKKVSRLIMNSLWDGWCCCGVGTHFKPKLLLVGKSLGAVRVIQFLNSAVGRELSRIGVPITAVTIDAHSPLLYGRWWSLKLINKVPVYNTYQWDNWPRGAIVTGAENIRQESSHGEIIYSDTTKALIRRAFKNILPG